MFYVKILANGGLSKPRGQSSGQDGATDKCCACLLPWPHQNANYIKEQ